MKIIIAPSKKMKHETEVVPHQTIPVFLEKGEKLANWLKSLSFRELQELLACNGEIAKLNYSRYSSVDLNKNLSPALLSFDGIQYKYMAPLVFDYSSFDYVENHLRILSGLYGILRPLDGVVPYRLEMQAKVKTGFCKNLYDYWGDAIYKELTHSDNVILNLASKEYSKVVEQHLTSGVRLITCIFGEIKSDERNTMRIVEKGVYVKMARGEMVRFMAERNITDPEEVKEFKGLGFQYSRKLSESNKFVFVR